LAKRYHKFWITTEEKKKRKRFQLFRETIPRIWVSYDELVEYIKSFPQGHKSLMKTVRKVIHTGKSWD